MDWEEEDVTQRFASNLVPRQTPTKQEEELLKSKVEARRLLMKLNGALDTLRAHMLPEIEEDDDEDSSGPEAAIHRQTKSTFGGRRRRGGESENYVSRRKHTEAEYDDHRRSPKRPEWNTRFQPTDSPLDYELPRYKKGFLPASPSKTLRNGSAKTQRRRNVSTKKTRQWDSRIIATRSALDDIPRYQPKPFRKKRVVSLKDLEHLAALAPTASLKELLDIGKHAIRTQATRKSQNINTVDAESNSSSYTNDDVDEVDDNLESQNRAIICSSDSDAAESFEEEYLDEYDEYEMKFDQNDNEKTMKLPESGKSLATVGGGNVNALLKKYGSGMQDRSRQIRYTKKSAINATGGKKDKKIVKFLPEKSYLEKIELRLQRGRKLQKLKLTTSNVLNKFQS